MSIFSTLPDGNMGELLKNAFLPGGGNHKVKPVTNANTLIHTPMVSLEVLL